MINIYFGTKFNPTIEQLVQIIPHGGSTKLSNFDSRVFYKESPTTKEYIKVIPLLMFNKLESNNNADRSYDYQAIVCKNNLSTTIKCWSESE